MSAAAGTGTGETGTYIGVSPDLLERLLVKVAGVAHQAADDVVCVLEALEDVGGKRELRPLAQLHALVVALGVDALHPIVVARGIGVLDVLLEHDHVRVGHCLGVHGRENGGGILVDGAHLEHRRRCGKSRQQSEGGVPHDECGSRGETNNTRGDGRETKAVLGGE